MIDLLNNECGTAVTFKISTLFKDLDLSKDLNKEFQKSESSKVTEGIDFHTTVINSTIFDTIDNEVYKIPKQLKICQDAFSNFYSGRFDKRALKWLYKRGEVVLETKFTPHPFILSVTFFQTMILDLFETREELTFNEIQEMTAIKENELLRQLRHLCNPNKKYVNFELLANCTLPFS